MWRERAYTILRVDAIFDLAFGVILLAAPVESLYEALDMPRTEPEFYMQLAGGLLIVFAYLLWEASTRHDLARYVARAAGLANLAGFGLIIAWLVAGGLGIGLLGGVLLGVVALTLAVFAVFEIGYLA